MCYLDTHSSKRVYGQVADDEDPSEGKLKTEAGNRLQGRIKRVVGSSMQ